MIKWIDNALNQITMYRLVLYYLIALLVMALLLSVVGALPVDPFALLFTIGVLLAVSWIANALFSRTFGVPANVESVYISALILALIISPIKTTGDFWFVVWAAVLAMASKYILAIGGKHVFNPVALAVGVTALTVNQTASWWVGSAVMLPAVFLGGALVVRKIRRFDLVLSFLLASSVTSLALSLLQGDKLTTTLGNIALSSPLFFFAFVILTEPLTTPPTRTLQVLYGIIVGVLFAPQVHVGAFYITPEGAILLGNVFSYLVSPKVKLVLRLKERVQLAPGIYEFIFAPRHKVAFKPGQYMEWTLGHDDPDSRGNRRYFTLASSPTENVLRLGVKVYEQSSSFKRSMLAMSRGTEIVASQLAGDFVLPDDPGQPCVFIAGGIGITPFRSMIKYLLDNHESRPIVLFYVNRTASEIAYHDVFDRAYRELGIRTVYTLTDRRRVPPGWAGQIGYVSPEMLAAEVPEYRDCLFYLSGPDRMVDSYRRALRQMSVSNRQIKTDFFPGLA